MGENFYLKIRNIFSIVGVESCATLILHVSINEIRTWAAVEPMTPHLGRLHETTPDHETTDMHKR